VFSITIDELEELVRRSIEEGVDHVSELIPEPAPCPPQDDC